MIYEMTLQCFDPDEWLYDPDRRPEIPSLLDKYLDFDFPWFEHHEYSRTVRYTEIDSMRILMRGHMDYIEHPSRIYWTPIE